MSGKRRKAPWKAWSTRRDVYLFGRQGWRAFKRQWRKGILGVLFVSVLVGQSAPPAPATEPASAPAGDTALALSKAYTKVMGAWADYQQAVRTQQDSKKALDDAQAMLRDLTAKAKEAQKIPAQCTLSPEIQWIVQQPAGPCMLPAAPAKADGKK